MFNFFKYLLLHKAFGSGFHHICTGRVNDIALDFECHCWSFSIGSYGYCFSDRVDSFGVVFDFNFTSLSGQHWGFRLFWNGAATARFYRSDNQRCVSSIFKLKNADTVRSFFNGSVIDDRRIKFYFSSFFLRIKLKCKKCEQQE